MKANVPANIIVIDDEKYICGIIAETLSSDPYKVISFTDPKEALDHICNNHVDLVLTDLVMGEQSGIEIIDTTLEHHQDAVVILMTAHPTVQTAISILKKGAYDFLVKPFKLETLRSTIKRGLGHQQVLRENLRLKGQVEFLKLAQASFIGMNIDQYLKMVVRSCRQEFSAAAVALLEINPDSQEVVRVITEGKDQQQLKSSTDENSLHQFNYTKSTKPVIQTSTIKIDGVTKNRIFISQPLFVRRRLHGVINVVIFQRFGSVTPGQVDLLAVLSSSASSAIANQRLYHDLRHSYMQAIRGLANAIEARDKYTAGHTDRVCKLAEIIAYHLGWDKGRINHLIMGCTLHDMGKIGVPDSILNKPGKLTEDEQHKMQQHPQVGLKIIHGIEFFKPAIPYIASHHEWYDGNGYPEGLKGEDIPIEGRLLAVVDTFDAIMSNRPYREGASLEYAVNELVTYKGTQFDPTIVDAFLEVLRQGRIDLKQLFNSDEDIASLPVFKSTEKAQA